MIRYFEPPIDPPEETEMQRIERKSEERREREDIEDGKQAGREAYAAGVPREKHPVGCEKWAWLEGWDDAEEAACEDMAETITVNIEIIGIQQIDNLGMAGAV